MAIVRVCSGGARRATARPWRTRRTGTTDGGGLGALAHAPTTMASSATSQPRRTRGTGRFGQLQSGVARKMRPTAEVSSLTRHDGAGLALGRVRDPEQRHRPERVARRREVRVGLEPHRADRVGQPVDDAVEPDPAREDVVAHGAHERAVLQALARRHRGVGPGPDVDAAVAPEPERGGHCRRTAGSRRWRPAGACRRSGATRSGGRAVAAATAVPGPPAGSAAGSSTGRGPPCCMRSRWAARSLTERRLGRDSRPSASMTQLAAGSAVATCVRSPADDLDRLRGDLLAVVAGRLLARPDVAQQRLLRPRSAPGYRAARAASTACGTGNPTAGATGEGTSPLRTMRFLRLRGSVSGTADSRATV